ncbi:MAG: translocation/assembly module TamB domain-containing protein, partial [Roseinatronobacter sp.]
MAGLVSFARIKAFTVLLVCLSTLLMPPSRAHAQFFDFFLPDTRTESDEGFLTRLLQDSLSDRGRAVRFTGFAGALSSRATFDQMTIADDEGVWLRISGAALQWNRGALLERRIEISEISAARVEILRPPVAQPSDTLVPATRFELPELPVSIRLDRLDLREVVLAEAVMGQAVRAGVSGSASLRSGSGAAQLQLDRLDDIEGSFSIEAAFANDTRNLSLDLSVSEAAGGLAVTVLGVPGAPSAALTVQGDGLIDEFEAAITLSTDGRERVEGQFVLQTALPGVAQALRLDLAGDLRPLMQPVYHPFFGPQSRLRTQARRFDDGRLSLDDLRIQTQKLRIDGRAQVGLNQLPELIDLRVQVSDPDGAQVVLPVPGGQTTIQSADMHLSFDARQSKDWDLTLDATRFDNGAVTIEKVFVNGLGRITSDGFGEDIDVVDALLDFGVLGLGVGDPGLQRALGRDLGGSLAFIWREGAPLLLPGLIIEGADYTIQGRARLDEGVVSGDGRAEFQDLARLSALAGRTLGGSVTLEWDGSVGPERDHFALRADLIGRDLRTSQPQLDRLLRGTSTVQAVVSGDEGVLTLTELRAQAQTLTAQLSGQVSAEQVNIRGDLDFRDLSVIDDGLGGALSAEVVVLGPTGREQIQLDSRLRDLRAGPPEVARLMAGETRITLAGTRGDLAFDLTHLAIDNAALRATASGRVDPGASTVQADVRLSDLGRIRSGLGGALTADLRLTETGARRDLTLAATASNLRAGQPALDNLLSGTTTLQAQVQHDPDGLLIRTARLSGRVLSADVQGARSAGSANMQVQARLASLDTVLPGIVGAATVAGSVRETAAGYALDLALTGPAGLNAQVAGTLGTDLRGDLRATGSTDIALINPRIEPRSVQGLAQFNATVNGPLTLASLNGQAQVRGAQLVIPERYINAQGLTGTIQITGGQVSVDVSGQLGTGGGARLRGGVTLLPDIVGDLTLDLDNARLIEPKLLETRLNGQVRITGPLTRGPSLSGALALNETEIRIPRVGLVSRGYIPPDIRHVGEGAASRITRERAGIFQGESHGRTRFASPLDLTLEAPSRIFVRGRGLDAELGGSLRLTGTTSDIIPIGQFGLIRGRLDLLGN